MIQIFSAGRDGRDGRDQPKVVQEVLADLKTFGWCWWFNFVNVQLKIILAVLRLKSSWAVLMVSPTGKVPQGRDQLFPVGAVECGRAAPVLA